MFKNLFKAVANVALTPVEVVKDIVTVGGLSTDEKEPYTIQRLKKAGKCLDKALDPDE